MQQLSISYRAFCFRWMNFIPMLATMCLAPNRTYTFVCVFSNNNNRLFIMHLMEQLYDGKLCHRVLTIKFSLEIWFSFYPLLKWLQLYVYKNLRFSSEMTMIIATFSFYINITIWQYDNNTICKLVNILMLDTPKTDLTTCVACIALTKAQSPRSSPI